MLHSSQLLENHAFGGAQTLNLELAQQVERVQQLDQSVQSALGDGDPAAAAAAGWHACTSSGLAWHELPCTIQPRTAQAQHLFTTKSEHTAYFDGGGVSAAAAAAATQGQAALTEAVCELPCSQMVSC